MISIHVARCTMHIYWKLSLIIHHTRNMVCCHMKPCCRPYRTCWTSGWGCPPSCRRRKGRREPALWTWLKSNWRIFRLLPWIRSSSCQYLSQNFCQNWMFLLNITTSFHPLKNLWEFGSNSTDFEWCYAMKQAIFRRNRKNLKNYDFDFRNSIIDSMLQQSDYQTNKIASFQDF